MSVDASGDAMQASLLSLSIAAASAQRIPTDPSAATNAAASFAPGSFTGPSSLPSSHALHQHTGSPATSAKLNASMKHRRLSSAGHAVKRRLSDAREAASRPSPVTISTAASALTSLATLSLSTSPAHALSNSTSGSVADDNSSLGKNEDAEAAHETATTELSAGGITIKNGKKRGMIFKCESCSKVYRHPSCLIKHRWEHSPHWREASKFLLSKHQQVQLLEAAAILSHLSPAANGGTSLPEDRSLWPSFLSGGALPPPSTTTPATANNNASKRSPGPASLDSRLLPTYPTSSSVPSRPLSTGPRLHDYAVGSGAGGVTHVRPGVFGVSTGSGSGSEASPPAPDVSMAGATRPVPVPVNGNGNGMYRDPYPSSDPWGSSSFHSSSYSLGAGGWSLPRSSVRSVSVTSGDSRSRSGSVPKSDVDIDEEDEEVEIDIEVDAGEEEYVHHDGGFVARGRTSATRGGGPGGDWGYAEVEVVGKPSLRTRTREAKIEEEEVWDGMEMEMEM
ncbi:hypothetical protein EIP91_012199 [Steccherinum ochraceum]|uniref:C2H2-type domain-containing protein n=1 Tax=Steccherinum ochraceum TaxID=92696 RepID=A0A4R0RXC9_9APHY|nr:hypothetical protein EIP91_012199 [Steccherinum ochraceum]